MLKTRYCSAWERSTEQLYSREQSFLWRGGKGSGSVTWTPTASLCNQQSAQGFSRLVSVCLLCSLFSVWFINFSSGLRHLGVWWPGPQILVCHHQPFPTELVGDRASGSTVCERQLFSLMSDFQVSSRHHSCTTSSKVTADLAWLQRFLNSWRLKWAEKPVLGSSSADVYQLDWLLKENLRSSVWTHYSPMAFILNGYDTCLQKYWAIS